MEGKFILGIDVGGSGVKGALVDLEKGQLKGERYRVPTPLPATPANVAAAFGEIVEYFNYQGPIGVGFPAIVKNGVALSAANIDVSWIGTDIQTTFEAVAPGCRVYAANDADVAGLAEMQFGAGKGNEGFVMMITIGTGLGSAIFYKGQMLPNTELGHLIFPKKTPAEEFASSGARERLKLGRKKWADRFNAYLLHLERLFTPDVFILGGGESKHFATFSEQLTTKATVVPAQLLNNAGIIGAAVYAQNEQKSTK